MGGTWLGLATVIAAGTPGAFAAYWGYRSSRGNTAIRNELVTGNDKTVGEMVTEVHGKESAQQTEFDTHRQPPLTEDGAAESRAEA